MRGEKEEREEDGQTRDESVGGVGGEKDEREKRTRVRH